MLSRTTFILVAFSLMLNGCAQVTHQGTNQITNQKLTSSRVVWEAPASLPIRYEILSTSSRASEQDKEAFKNYHLRKIEPFLEAIKSDVPADVTESLAKNGVTSGDESTITIRPIGAGSNSNGPNISLQIEVNYKDRTQSPWAVTVRTASAVFDTTKTVTSRIVKNIEDELVKAGFLNRL
jgi:hypothetical protein